MPQKIQAFFAYCRRLETSVQKTSFGCGSVSGDWSASAIFSSVISKQKSRNLFQSSLYRSRSSWGMNNRKVAKFSCISGNLSQRYLLTFSGQLMGLGYMPASSVSKVWRKLSIASKRRLRLTTPTPKEKIPITPNIRKGHNGTVSK